MKGFGFKAFHTQIVTFMTQDFYPPTSGPLNFETLRAAWTSNYKDQFEKKKATKKHQRCCLL